MQNLQETRWKIYIWKCEHSNFIFRGSQESKSWCLESDDEESAEDEEPHGGPEAWGFFIDPFLVVLCCINENIPKTATSDKDTFTPASESVSHFDICSLSTQIVKTFDVEYDFINLVTIVNHA